MGLHRRSGLDSDFPLRSLFQRKKLSGEAGEQGGKERKEDGGMGGTSGNDLCLLASSHRKSAGALAAVESI